MLTLPIMWPFAVPSTEVAAVLKADDAAYRLVVDDITDAVTAVRDLGFTHSIATNRQQVLRDMMPSATPREQRSLQRRLDRWAAFHDQLRPMMHP